MSNQALISLKRMDNNQPWGFRLKGGADQGLQLYIEHVQGGGRAAHAGLRPGDLVLSVCGVPTCTLSHSQVKGEMLRAGNELDLVIQRDGDVTSAGQQEAVPEEPRSVVDDKPLEKMGGPRFKHVPQKTFKVLEEQLQGAETTTAMDAPVTEGPRPASIFDRKKQDRSDYLVSKGKTIQDAFGQDAF